MKKKSNLIIVSICLSLFMLSCSKEDLVNEEPGISSLPELQVKNGMLDISSDMEFIEFRSVITNCTDEQFRAWEKKMGFESYYSKLEEFYSELETVSSQEEIFLLVDQYVDFVQIIEGRAGLEIVEFIEHPFYQRITNSNGLFTFENMVTKVCGDFTYTTSHDNIEELNKIKSYDEVVTTKNVVRHQFRNKVLEIDKPRLKTDQCWSMQMYDWGWKDPRGCKKDRRVRLLIEVEKNSLVPPDIVTVDVLTEVKGQDKSFCVWHNKKIEGLQWKDVYYKVLYDGVNYDTNLPDRYVSEAQYRTFIWENLYNGLDNFNDPWFQEGSGQATHNEMDGKWAIIDCQ